MSLIIDVKEAILEIADHPNEPDRLDDTIKLSQLRYDALMCGALEDRLRGIAARFGIGAVIPLGSVTSEKNVNQCITLAGAGRS